MFYFIFQIILPFVMLITFNILTYDKIIQFEQTLVTQIRAQNTSQRQNSSVRRFREGSRSTISEYHHSGRGRGSNAASHNSAQNHNTVGKICILSFWQIDNKFRVSTIRTPYLCKLFLDFVSLLFSFFSCFGQNVKLNHSCLAGVGAVCRFPRVSFHKKWDYIPMWLFLKYILIDSFSLK